MGELVSLVNLKRCVTRDCRKSSPSSRPTVKPISRELSSRKCTTELLDALSSRETSENSLPSGIGHGGNCTSWCNPCCLWPVQRNIRKFFAIRNWPWWKLYLLVQPMLSVARAEEEMEEKEAALQAAMENAEANAKKLTDIEEQLTVVLREKEKLFDELRSENSRLIETEEQLTVVTNEKNQLEFDLNDATEKLDGEAHS